jgi:hypothetical protein
VYICDAFGQSLTDGAGPVGPESAVGCGCGFNSAVETNVMMMIVDDRQHSTLLVVVGLGAWAKR